MWGCTPISSTHMYFLFFLCVSALDSNLTMNWSNIGIWRDLVIYDGRVSEPWMKTFRITPTSHMIRNMQLVRGCWLQSTMGVLCPRLDVMVKPMAWSSIMSDNVSSHVNQEQACQPSCLAWPLWKKKGYGKSNLGCKSWTCEGGTKHCVVLWFLLQVPRDGIGA